MKVLSNNNFPISLPLAATIGFFDGVHGGHRFLLRELKSIAEKRGLPTAVITFPVHPRIVLQSDYQPELLNTREEKIELLSRTGMDYAIVLDFNRSMAKMTAQDFIREILHAKMDVKTLLTGYDHRFGHLRADGFEQYREYGAACGMEVIQATPYLENGITVSSSKIRSLLHAGDIATANALLGYHYTIEGLVVEGNQIGRTIGFPTANIRTDNLYKLVPAFGSYAVWVTVGKFRYKGMLYIGTKPTVNKRIETFIEVNIFDFSKNIYNMHITIEFVDFIRADRQFLSLDELKSQLEKDREAALARFKV
ncbi:MAG: riboflavin biosynthesis protein RibF [Tannerella sp.]|nr:riboflavin biosynthesis protein RibF [Tannerella sp.]